MSLKILFFCSNSFVYKKKRNTFVVKNKMVQFITDRIAFYWYQVQWCIAKILHEIQQKTSNAKSGNHTCSNVWKFPDQHFIQIQNTCDRYNCRLLDKVMLNERMCKNGRKMEQEKCSLILNAWWANTKENQKSNHQKTDLIFKTCCKIKQWRMWLIHKYSCWTTLLFLSKKNPLYE